MPDHLHRIQIVELDLELDFGAPAGGRFDIFDFHGQAS